MSGSKAGFGRLACNLSRNLRPILLVVEVFCTARFRKCVYHIIRVNKYEAGSLQESLLDPYPDSYHSKATLKTDRRGFEGNLKYLFLSITGKLSIFHIF